MHPPSVFVETQRGMCKLDAQEQFHAPPSASQRKAARKAPRYGGGGQGSASRIPSPFNSSIFSIVISFSIIVFFCFIRFSIAAALPFASPAAAPQQLARRPGRRSTRVASPQSIRLW